MVQSEKAVQDPLHGEADIGNQNAKQLYLYICLGCVAE